MGIFDGLLVPSWTQIAGRNPHNDTGAPLEGKLVGYGCRRHGAGTQVRSSDIFSTTISSAVPLLCNKTYGHSENQEDPEKKLEERVFHFSIFFYISAISCITHPKINT